METTASASFKQKHLLGIEGLAPKDIEAVLSTAASFKEISEREIKKVPTLRGKTIINLFLEPSTRTRASFEIAAKRLSADTISFSGSGSSLEKGESFKDMTLTLEAMKPDYIVIRHQCAGAPQLLTRWTQAAVINAGDGAHEHPTQALLDLFTIKEIFGKFHNLKVSIIGDIAHSRVARSDIWGLTKLGAKVTVAGPKTMLPPEISALGVKVTTDMTQALHETDVVMLLRIQRERQDNRRLPSLREYAKFYGLDGDRLKTLPDHAVIMHPGPLNRGVEISPDVADSGRAIITHQVTNGIAVRMAVLYLLQGGREK